MFGVKPQDKSEFPTIAINPGDWDDQYGMDALIPIEFPTIAINPGDWDEIELQAITPLFQVSNDRHKPWRLGRHKLLGDKWSD